MSNCKYYEVIDYNSDDYYGFMYEDTFYYGTPEENGFENIEVEYIYDELSSQINYEQLLEEFGDTEGILEGSMGLWNGRYAIDEVIITLDDALSRLRDVDTLDVYWDEDEKGIVIKNHHHDGTNWYCLKPFDCHSKNELYNVAKEIKKEVGADDPISRYNKEELIDFIREYS